MKEFMIEKGIVIDDAEAVIRGIQGISGKKLSGLETVRKFILNEKSTGFYLNNKCLSRMQPAGDTVYLWLDSGYTDSGGRPVMISLLRNGDGYAGHYCGTIRRLAENIRSYYPYHASEIEENAEILKKKYETKAAERIHGHIEDENTYLVELCNGDREPGIMSRLLDSLEIDFPEEPEEENIPEETEKETAKPEYDMNLEEKEITIGLLLETIDGMQDYIDELLGEIEKFNKEDRVRIRELEEKNAEYKRAMVQMRSFIASESKEERKDRTGSVIQGGIQNPGGHELLGNNKKVLILGATALDINIMYGIAKLFGFQKKDLEFETDYEKISGFTGRISSGEKYAAIILGACPHKVAGLGKWSSLVEKCSRSEDMPYTFDARSHSGELKMTKESFKTALRNVCRELTEQTAG